MVITIVQSSVERSKGPECGRKPASIITRNNRGVEIYNHQRIRSREETEGPKAGRGGALWVELAQAGILATFHAIRTYSPSGRMISRRGRDYEQMSASQARDRL